MLNIEISVTTVYNYLDAPLSMRLNAAPVGPTLNGSPFYNMLNCREPRHPSRCSAFAEVASAVAMNRFQILSLLIACSISIGSLP